MELFLDDPNDDVDTEERMLAKNIHLLSMLGSIIPPFNFILPYIYSKIKTSNSKFVKQHTSNALNFQVLVLLLVLIAIAMYFYTGFFYVLLYSLFLFLFQTFYSYQAYTAAQSGTLNYYPYSLSIF